MYKISVTFWYTLTSSKQRLCLFKELPIAGKSVPKHVVVQKSLTTCIYWWIYWQICRSQWPRGLRRRSTAARLLTSWVRTPPGAWMSVVSVVCPQVEVSATSLSLVQRSPTDCRVWSRNHKNPREWGGQRPLGGGGYRAKGVNKCWQKYGRYIKFTNMREALWADIFSRFFLPES